jgi:dihydropteroate synthase
MGILNITPDSFSDGGRYTQVDAALEHAQQMIAAGVDIIDLGAESTRPGAARVPATEELSRLLAVLEPLLAESSVPISVDTCKADVAAAVLRKGCHAINDVTALSDPAMARVVARFDAGVVLMHMRGSPRTMQDAPQYEDVVAEVGDYLRARVKCAERAGVATHNIFLDPGIGFGKTLQHNLELLRSLPQLNRIGFPLVVGTSRKSFLGALTGKRVEARDAGTVASVATSVLLGAAVVRVHDVALAVDAVRVAAAIRDARPGEGSKV